MSFPEPEPVPEPENPGKGYPKTGAFAEVDPVTASVAVVLLCSSAGAVSVLKFTKQPMYSRFSRICTTVFVAHLHS